MCAVFAIRSLSFVVVRCPLCVAFFCWVLGVAVVVVRCVLFVACCLWCVVRCCWLFAVRCGRRSLLFVACLFVVSLLPVVVMCFVFAYCC